MKKLKISDIELASDTNLPEPAEGKFIKLENGIMNEYNKNVFGDLVNSSKNPILAKTVNENGFSKIWVSPGLKGVNIDGHYLAKTILNHEFIHCYHLTLGLKNEYFLERSAWSYNYAYARANGLNIEPFLKQIKRWGGFNVSNYTWSNSGLDKFIKLF
jgi:hypothetical protein